MNGEVQKEHTYNLHFGDSNSDLSDSLSAYSEHSNSYRPYGMYLFMLFFVSIH